MKHIINTHCGQYSQLINDIKYENFENDEAILLFIQSKLPDGIEFIAHTSEFRVDFDSDFDGDGFWENLEIPADLIDQYITEHQP